MPLIFSNLAPHLRLATINKLNYDMFGRFQQTSKNGLEISKSLKIKLPLFIKEVTFEGERPLDLQFWEKRNRPTLSFETLREQPVLLCVESVDIVEFGSHEDLSDLADHLENSNIQAAGLFYSSDGQFGIKFSLLDRMVKNLGCEWVKLLARYAELEDYEDLPSFDKLELLTLEGEVSDELLTSLKAETIVILATNDAMTLDGLKTCLRNPKANCLKMSYPWYLFKEYPYKEEEDYSPLFEGLEYSILWKEDFHHKSPLSAVPYEEDGVAYIVSVGNQKMLVSMTNTNCLLEKLKGESEKEIRDDAWQKLRAFLEQLAENGYELY